MDATRRYAVLDLETRLNLDLARQVLPEGATLPRADLQRQMTERRRSENGGSDFQKLPFHEPVASAVLLAEQAGPAAPVLATGWCCWRAGDAPVDQFVRDFFGAVAGRVYVGFNSQAFDLPVMELWASRCRVPAAGHFRDARATRGKYGDRHLDLQKELANHAWGSGSFDELCKFHGLPGKPPGVRGADVEALVAAGQLDEVHAYNVTDVLQTFLLLLHVLVRDGSLDRAAAAASVASALGRTREDVLARLSPDGKAHALLAGSLDRCAVAPIAGV